MKLSILIILFVTYFVVGCNEQYPASVVKSNSTGSNNTGSGGSGTNTSTTTPTVTDTDGDGVLNTLDLCSTTATSGTYNISGCTDTDNDGIPSAYDQCSTTPAISSTVVNIGLASLASWVTSTANPEATVVAAVTALQSAITATIGCSDIDQDGVLDGTDKCDQYNATTASTSSVNTPTGATISALGCPSDTDGDGVYNGLDKCTTTPSTASANAAPKFIDYAYYQGLSAVVQATTATVLGCLDNDSDNYYENTDSCPNELGPVIITTAASRSSNGCLYGFEVTLNGGNTSKRVLHRAGVSATTATTSTVAADTRCIVYNDAISNYANFSIYQPIETATSEVLCWLDIDETELKQNGFTFQVNSAPLMCEFVWYDPYFFYQWDAGPANPSAISGYSLASQIGSATYAYTSVAGKTVGYRRRAFDTTVSGASCSTCIIPDKDANGTSIPLGNVNVSCASNEAVPGGGSSFCAYDHTASTGPNCDETYYGVINYQLDYAYLDATTKLSPGASSGSIMTVNTSAAGVCVDGSNNYTSCITGDASCPASNKYASSAAFKTALNAGRTNTSYCAHNYDATYSCDTGAYVASLDASTGNLYTVSGTVCTAVSTNIDINVSCNGSASNCRTCTLMNTATATTAELKANLDSNPANDVVAGYWDPAWSYKTPVSCGGNRNSCLSGPGTAYKNASNHPIGLLQSAITGTPNISSWQYSIPSTYYSNVYLANWSAFLRYSASTAAASADVTNTCTLASNATYSPQAMMDFTATVGTSTISDPFKGTQPFYTFYCLDSGFDVKGVIRVQVRDWDSSLSTVSGTTYIYNTNTSSVTDALSAGGTMKMDRGGVNPVLGGLYSDYFDWDDFVHYPNGRPVSGTSGLTAIGVSSSYQIPAATATGIPACLTPTSTFPFPNNNL